MKKSAWLSFLFLAIIAGSLIFIVASRSWPLYIEPGDGAGDSNVAVRPAGEQLMGSTFIVPGVGTAVDLRPEPVDYGSGNNSGSVVFLPQYAVETSVADAEYIMAPVAANTGGSGMFVYLVLYEKQDEHFRQAGEVLLGDRIKIADVAAVSGGQVRVTIYERAAAEPFSAEPTVPKTLSFTIENGRLVSNQN